MKNVRDVVSRDVIEDLWGAGYTILPRRRHADPFHVPQEMVPQGRSYQWRHLVHDKFHFERPDGATPSGWAPVPASRHDGYFMPAGYVGDIEVNGLGLFEKSKFEVDQERQANVQKAQDAADPAKFFAGKGFSGSVTVGTQTKLGEMDSVKTTKIGETKTIENTTAVPRDMVPHIGRIFEERDYLAKLYVVDCASENPVWSTVTISEIATEMEFAMKCDPDTPKWPTLNGIILPHAIANIRKRITEEAASGQAS